MHDIRVLTPKDNDEAGYKDKEARGSESRGKMTDDNHLQRHGRRWTCTSSLWVSLTLVECHFQAPSPYLSGSPLLVVFCMCHPSSVPAVPRMSCRGTGAREVILKFLIRVLVLKGPTLSHYHQGNWSQDSHNYAAYWKPGRSKEEVYTSWPDPQREEFPQFWDLSVSPILQVGKLGFKRGKGTQNIFILVLWLFISYFLLQYIVCFNNFSIIVKNLEF